MIEDQWIDDIVSRFGFRIRYNVMHKDTRPLRNNIFY